MHLLQQTSRWQAIPKAVTKFSVLQADYYSLLGAFISEVNMAAEDLGIIAAEETLINYGCFTVASLLSALFLQFSIFLRFLT